jgi:hypothetical protein
MACPPGFETEHLDVACLTEAGSNQASTNSPLKDRFGVSLRHGSLPTQPIAQIQSRNILALSIEHASINAIVSLQIG